MPNTAPFTTALSNPNRKPPTAAVAANRATRAVRTLVRARLQGALRNALCALQIRAPEGVTWARQLEHRRQLVADEEWDHRGSAHAATAAREANRERVFGQAIRRTE